MIHSLLSLLHKITPAHPAPMPAKDFAMELMYLIIINILAAFLLFIAIAAFIVWLPMPTVQKHVQFSDKDDFDLTTLEPYPIRPIEGRTTYKMTMGLRRLDRKNWLTIDKNYLEEHQVRNELLASNKTRVIRCLAGSEQACGEVLEVVVEYLTQRYPNAFRMTRGPGKATVCIAATGEAFQVSSPYGGMNPLEIAARLTMEDLSVLINHRKDAEYLLAASATMFPVGWNVSQRVGWPLSRLHGSVPTWKTNIGWAANNFFSHIRETNSLERSTYFIQASPPEDSLLSRLFRPDVLSDQARPKVRDIYIRRERQTFTKLPKSRAILFAVKTSLTPLRDLGPEERLNLGREIRSWPEPIAAYKGRGSWGECVLGFIECGIEE